MLNHFNPSFIFFGLLPSLTGFGSSRSWPCILMTQLFSGLALQDLHDPDDFFLWISSTLLQDLLHGLCISQLCSAGAAPALVALQPAALGLHHSVSELSIPANAAFPILQFHPSSHREAARLRSKPGDVFLPADLEKTIKSFPIPVPPAAELQGRFWISAVLLRDLPGLLHMPGWAPELEMKFHESGLWKMDFL